MTDPFPWCREWTSTMSMQQIAEAPVSWNPKSGQGGSVLHALTKKLQCFFWKSMPTNYSRLGKSDWSLLKPLLQTTKLCTWPHKERWHKVSGKENTKCNNGTSMNDPFPWRREWTSAKSMQQSTRRSTYSSCWLQHQQSRSWERPKLTYSETAL